MKFTDFSMDRSRLTLFSALLVLLAGLWVWSDFPSQEEPDVTIRDALVFAAVPGLPTERVELLLTQPLEEKLRELAEVKRLQSTARAGQTVVQVTLHDTIYDLDTVWQKVRAKLAEVALPEGAAGPFLDSDFGRVAVASIVVRAPGFSMGEMRTPLKRFRAALYTLPGVAKVSFHGLQEERIYLEFDPRRFAQLGLSTERVVADLARQNIVRGGGVVAVGGLTATVETTGEARSLEALRRIPIALPAPAVSNGAGAGGAGSGDVAKGSGIVLLGDLARITRGPADPPEAAAVANGDPAVVVAVAMSKGENVRSFGQRLKARVAEAEALLPVGFQLSYASFQADVVDVEMSKMNRVMLETLVIVMGVVVCFLGLRTGVIVGAIVPLTILATLIVMRMFDIPLQSVSIAAIIIALGLLVDNGIVIAEDIERRLAAGEERRQACLEAGRTLAVPLFVSSLTIVLAFLPLLLAQNATGEYARSLSIVLAITLFASWLLCLTVTPLLCYRFLKPHAAAADHSDAQYDTRFYRGYRRLLDWVLQHKAIYFGAMAAALAGGVLLLALVPYDFLPPSERPQFQMNVELTPGADARATYAAVRGISKWLGDTKANPEVQSHVGYVADGGPRFILGLNPPLPAPHRGYFVVTVNERRDLPVVMARLRTYLADHHPELRGDPKLFSLGVTEAGTAVYRLIGPDIGELQKLAQALKAKVQAQPGVNYVRDDWEARVGRLVVRVDQAKARAAGVTSKDIADTLTAVYSGHALSEFRENEVTIPVLGRAIAPARTGWDSLATMPIYPEGGGTAVLLEQVAKVELATEPSVIRRYNLNRAVTVEARHPKLTADGLVQAMAPQIAELDLPPGYRIELGGEIEEAAEANAALGQFLPLCLLLMLLVFVAQFNSFRKLVIILASIPFVLIGVSLGHTLSGVPFSFMATLGVLSLAGIIVNNAILLLERIEVERQSGLSLRDAVLNAGVKRLRPIIMTKLTCIVGLIPLMLFGGAMWRPMAVTIMGGLALGTLITLGLIPAMFEALFRRDGRRLAVAGAPALAGR